MLKVGQLMYVSTSPMMAAMESAFSACAALCRGDGYFEGPGNFTMDYGTFNGYGFINGTSGSYTGRVHPCVTLPRSHDAA